MLKKSIQILFCFLLLSTFESVAQKKDQKSKNAPAAPPAASVIVPLNDDTERSLDAVSVSAITVAAVYSF